MQVEETTTSTTNSALPPTRASFIRSLPLSMPVDEVIERGREAGIQLQPSDIHAARYYMRQAAAQEPVAKPSKPKLSSTIAEQLMLGGTLSAPREARETKDTRDDETAGLTKIAGVRNGASRAAQKPGAEPAPAKETKPAIAVTARGKRGREDKAVRANGVKARGAGTPVEISIDDVLKSVMPASTGRGRAGRRAPDITGSMEEQLHSLVLRLGTQRAREIIDQIEEVALGAS